MPPATIRQSFDALLSSIATASIHPSMTAEFSVDTPSVIAGRRKTCIPPSLRTDSESLNIAWLSNLVAEGYPEVLIHRLIGRALHDGDEDSYASSYQSIMDQDWEHTPTGKAFYRLVLHTGFQPVPDEDSDDEEEGSHYNLRSKKPPSPVDSATQRSLARTVARHRVYNLRYLSENRLWGPYLPMTPIPPRPADTEVETLPLSQNPSILTTDEPGDFSLPFIRALLSDFSVFVESHNILFGDDDDDDDDFVPSQSGSGDEEAANNQDEDDEDESKSEASDPEIINFQLVHRNAEEDEGGDGDDEGEDNDNDNDGASDDDEDSAEPDATGPTSTRAPPLPVPIYPIQPHLLRPDYAFLSAARIVVEDNLRERYGHKLPHDHETLWPWFTTLDALDSTRVILERARSLDGLRMGGAPSFWGGVGIRGEDRWFEDQFKDNDEEDENPPEAVKDKKKGVEANGLAESGDTCEGWDWAGAEGKWMRAVAWMDYRDLLFHNVRSLQASNPLTSGARLSEDIQETIRVFAMDIKITGYSRVPPPTSLEGSSSAMLGTSRPPDPKGKGKAKATDADLLEQETKSEASYDPLVYALPIIHISGEYRGSDVDEHAQRRCRGTVRMIGDRAVRWTLITSDVATPNQDEWVMEGVQVGGIGSKLGIVGMWTGASHERGDPIGPSWAWKMD
ncbi:hypothetical protein AAF712_004671 [Marasmius tenuissimus]|uniref:Uncharacterized protein n=1 Tax=Marasmius tenuissimus TaxID=585030 RepID=A0ABR3A4H9_9AGAR